MRYVSTRGGGATAGFSDILLGGLMEDGGLALPETYPRVGAAELKAWRQLDYRDLAFEIVRLYADDIPARDLKRLVDRTYTAAIFGADAITPVRPLQPGV